MTNLETDTQRAIRYFNIELVLTMLAIFTVGMFTLYSATAGPGIQSLVKTQGIRFGIGVLISLPLIFIDPQVIKRFSYVIYGGTLFLLVAVLIIGKVGGGSQRWLFLGPLQLQPSELAKVAIVIVFARYFSEYRFNPPYSLKQLLVPMVWLVPGFVLILVQPDVGTAGVYLFGAASILLFMGIQFRSLLIVLMISLITVPLAYNFVLKDYQRQRVKTFLNPGSDPRGSGYNSLQCRIAVGSGKVMGKGYMKGTQAQLNFIPEQHTDFIFSVFAEEHGFVGGIILLFLFYLYCYYALKTVSRGRDKFEVLLAFGLMAIFFWHVFINLGMVVGILPIVGVTLPFVSHGGTSLVTFMMTTALILNLSRKRFIF